MTFSTSEGHCIEKVVCITNTGAFSVPLDSLSLSTMSLDKATKDQILLDSHAWPLPLLLSRLMPVLRRGLDKRIKLIAPVIKSQHMVRSTSAVIMVSFI